MNQRASSTRTACRIGLTIKRPIYMARSYCIENEYWFLIEKKFFKLMDLSGPHIICIAPSPHWSLCAGYTRRCPRPGHTHVPSVQVQCPHMSQSPGTRPNVSRQWHAMREHLLMWFDSWTMDSMYEINRRRRSRSRTKNREENAFKSIPNLSLGHEYHEGDHILSGRDADPGRMYRSLGYIPDTDNAVINVWTQQEQRQYEDSWQRKSSKKRLDELSFKLWLLWPLPE